MRAGSLGTTNTAGLSVDLACFFLFAVAYNCFYDGGFFVYTAEIWSIHLRSEGVTAAMDFLWMRVGLQYPSANGLRAGWKEVSLGVHHYHICFDSRGVFLLAGDNWPDA
jgi:hypothetical protein